MNLKIPVHVKGFIKCEALKDGKVVRETDFFPNMITKIGLNRLGETTTSWARSNAWCFVGTGNTAPTINDTALVSQLAKAQISGTNVTLLTPTAPDYYSESQCVITFPVGAVVGNVAEMGFSTTSTDTDLCVRELVRDSGGSPTTISVSASESLRVTYHFRKYVPQGDFIGTTAEGDNYTIRALRALNDWSAQNSFLASSNQGDVTAYSGSLAGIESTTPLGSIVGSQGSDVLLPQTYVADSYSLTYAGDVLGSNCNGTFSTLQFFGATAPFTLQVEFDNPQTKTSSDKMHIEFTITWAEKAI